MRKSFLPWLVCAAIAAVGVPALAWGEPGGGRIEAPTDAAFVTGDNFFQDTAGAAGDNSVTITPGGKVTFTSPVNETNSAVHNVDFDFDTQPASCNQTGRVSFSLRSNPSPLFETPVCRSVRPVRIVARDGQHSGVAM